MLAYAFDEGSGDTLADETGNGHTGTIANATWSPEGYFGSALVYNGVNSRVTVANAATISITRDFTSEYWLRPDADTPIITPRGVVTLPGQTWSHTALTYNGARLTLYLNGAVALSTPFVGTVRVVNDTLYINNYPFCLTCFAGRVDEWRLYTRALSATEIQADLRRPVGFVPGPGQ